MNAKLLNFARTYRSYLFVAPILFLCGFILPVLKLANCISWNWIWVFAPIWLPIASYIVFVFCVTILTITTETGFWLVSDENPFKTN